MRPIRIIQNVIRRNTDARRRDAIVSTQIDPAVPYDCRRTANRPRFDFQRFLHFHPILPARPPLAFTDRGILQSVLPKPHALELRTKLSRVPAKIPRRWRGIKNHIRCHATTHRDVCVGDQRSSQSKRSPPQPYWYSDDSTAPMHSVKDASHHLAVGYGVAPRYRIDLVRRGRT